MPAVARFGCVTTAGAATKAAFDGEQTEVDLGVFGIARPEPLVDILPHRPELHLQRGRALVGHGLRVTKRAAAYRRNRWHVIFQPLGCGAEQGCGLSGMLERRFWIEMGKTCRRARPPGCGLPAVSMTRRLLGALPMKKRHRALNAPDAPDHRADEQRDDAGVGDDEAGVVLLPRVARESGGGEVDPEEDEPGVEPGRVVDVGAGDLGVEARFVDGADRRWQTMSTTSRITASLSELRKRKTGLQSRRRVVGLVGMG